MNFDKRLTNDVHKVNDEMEETVEPPRNKEPEEQLKKLKLDKASGDDNTKNRV